MTHHIHIYRDGAHWIASALGTKIYRHEKKERVERYIVAWGIENDKQVTIIEGGF